MDGDGEIKDNNNNLAAVMLCQRAPSSPHLRYHIGKAAIAMALLVARAGLGPSHSELQCREAPSFLPTQTFVFKLTSFSIVVVALS